MKKIATKQTFFEELHRRKYRNAPGHGRNKPAITSVEHASCNGNFMVTEA